MPDPISPQPSASVILLKDRPDAKDPFALFLLRRQGESRFMPNRYVFPGGRVEERDGEDPWTPEALKICALRELWEEAGVILAQDRKKAAAIPPEARQAARAALQAGETGLNEALEALGLAPDLGALTPYARWITPAARNMRFDTVFYLAPAPPEQEAESDRKETSAGLWLAPQKALAQNLAGEVALAPPQVRILGELSEYASLEELLNRNRQNDLAPVRPFMWMKEGRRIVLLPHDPEYAQKAPSNPDSPGRPCPAGQATRVVDKNGLWLPYRWPA
jgi:8-oxo-dGTP pyrophosphatase MutT (NUDIX family)